MRELILTLADIYLFIKLVSHTHLHKFSVRKNLGEISKLSLNSQVYDQIKFPISDPFIERVRSDLKV